ncbi:MAG: PIN domain-containing protein [Nocardioides sp.]
MILVDSSVWIDHLRGTDPTLVTALHQNEVLIHPGVLGEIALGSLTNRHAVLTLMSELPRALVARDDEVLQLIERRRLHGRGIGYVDAALLAAALLTPNTRLWTRDRRLHDVAADMGVPVLAA